MSSGMGLRKQRRAHFILWRSQKNCSKNGRRKKIPVKVSKLFLTDLNRTFQYGVETFGLRQAELYENEIWKLVKGLSGNWLLFSECLHLPDL